MPKYFSRLLRCILFSIIFSSASADAPTQIIFWHSMQGSFSQNLNIIIQQFNSTQSDYQVVPIYKGNYPNLLADILKAFKDKKPLPDLAQLFDVGTGTLIYTKGMIVPLYKIMQENNQLLNEKDFLQPIRFYYSDSANHLLALPFNISVPVVFYNKDALKKAGLDPNQLPKTWPELAMVATKLLNAGYKCGFTSSWPAWIQLEAFSAWHNLPYASDSNGFNGIDDISLLFNNPAVKKQMTALAEWQQQGVFQFAGSSDDPMVMFNSGECPILMESSAAEPELLDSSQFSVGVAPLPYWPDVAIAPQNPTFGGAAIWVLADRVANVNKGIAKFLAFLARPDIQAEWAKATGYLPTTQSAYKILQDSGYYKDNPQATIGFKALLNKPTTVNSRGFRLGDYMEIRNIIDAELKAAILGKKTVEQAIDSAITKGNNILKQFKQQVSP